MEKNFSIAIPCTCDCGVYYSKLKNLLNPNGFAQLTEQLIEWKRGLHRRRIEAYRQNKRVKINRIKNGKIIKKETGFFGINLHSAYGLYVNKSSAGVYCFKTTS